jgi:hypothetical protein
MFHGAAPFVLLLLATDLFSRSLTWPIASVASSRNCTANVNHTYVRGLSIRRQKSVFRARF